MQWRCNPHVTKGVREEGVAHLTTKKVKSGSRIIEERKDGEIREEKYIMRGNLEVLYRQFEKRR